MSESLAGLDRSQREAALQTQRAEMRAAHVDANFADLRGRVNAVRTSVPGVRPTDILTGIAAFAAGVASLPYRESWIITGAVQPAPQSARSSR